MSEPDVAAVIAAAEPVPTAVVNVQPVSLKARKVEPVADDDPRVAQLAQLGLTDAEARRLIAEQW